MALETPEWLNIDFTERILRTSENDRTIQVIDIFAKPATSKGDNYTSDMMRVTAEIKRKKGDELVTEKTSLIFKFEPSEEGSRKDLVTNSQIFDIEIAMVTDTLKKMNAMLCPEFRLGARAYHIRLERPLCLILEDLATLGYRMADREAGLDLAHCMMAIRGLARFHASSVALCEKEPGHKETYKRGIFHEDYPAEMGVFFEYGCRALADEVESWSELGKPYADKLRALAPLLYQKGTKLTKRNDNDFNVINHGDCWVNNMLFRYDENGKVIGHIFVDFQICVYSSPAIDLHYFLNTSPSLSVYENHLDALVQEYVSTLRDMMAKLNCKTPLPTLDNIKRQMEERALYGLISSMTILPVVMVEKSKVKDINEMMSKDGVYTNPGYSNPAYRKVMVKRLPKYREMGLLDP